MRVGFNEMRIFISSPGDVQDERKIAKKVIEDVSSVCKDPLQLHIGVIRWEDMTPMAPTEKTIQEKINATIHDCHVFILILNKRFGQIENGFNISNTEREIEEAFKLKKRNKKIKFLAYFKEIPENSDPGEQERGVKEMKERLVADKGVLYSSYKDSSHFKQIFTHHIYMILPSSIVCHHSNHLLYPISGSSGFLTDILINR